MRRETQIFDRHAAARFAGVTDEEFHTLRQVGPNNFSGIKDTFTAKELLDLPIRLTTNFLMERERLFAENGIGLAVHDWRNTIASRMGHLTVSFNTVLARKACSGAFRTLLDTANPVRLPMFALALRESMQSFLTEQAPDPKITASPWYRTRHDDGTKKAAPSWPDRLIYYSVCDIDIGDFAKPARDEIIATCRDRGSFYRRMSQKAHFKSANIDISDDEINLAAVDLCERAVQALDTRRCLGRIIAYQSILLFSPEARAALCNLLYLEGEGLEYTVRRIDAYVGQENAIILYVDYVVQEENKTDRVIARISVERGTGFKVHDLISRSRTTLKIRGNPSHLKFHASLERSLSEYMSPDYDPSPSP